MATTEPAEPNFATFDIARFPASEGSDGQMHPVVVVTFRGAPKSHDEMQAYLDEFEATLKSALEMGVTMRFVIDIKDVSATDALSFLWYIASQVAFIRRIGEKGSFNADVGSGTSTRLVDGIYCTAIVVGSSAKVLLDAVLARVTLQKPNVVLSSVEEAVAWNPAVKATK